MNRSSQYIAAAAAGVSAAELSKIATGEETAPKTPVGQAPEPARTAALPPASEQEKQLQAQGSQDAGAFRRVGDAYAAENKPADATRLYEKANKLKPDAGAFAKVAELAAERGDRAGALSAAKQALALDPEQPLAKLVQGHADELGSAEGRAKVLGKNGFGAKGDAGDLAGGGSGAGAAGTRRRAGAYDDAPLFESEPGDRERAMALVTGRAGLSPLVKQALTKARLGERGEALLLLSQAVDADPKDAAAWLLRSELQSEARDFPAAESDATRALALSPPPAMTARALRARAFAELQEGKTDAALADAARAVELDPSSGLGFLYKAMAEEKLGRAAEALADARRALALDPALRATAAPLFARLGRPLDVSDAAAGSPAPRRRLPLLLAAGVGGALLLAVGVLGPGRRGAAEPAPSDARPAADPGATLVDQPGDIAAGALVGGQYRVTRELGRGGMGVVYEALDETLQRRVALKRVQGGSPEDLERLLREARLVAQLKHPRIAEIHNVVLDREPLLVFELIEGRALDAALREKGRCGAEEARRIVAQVCEALECAHGRGIIHRDLKPSNVMLAADGSCKVMDFGIAHQSQGAAAATRTAASGTPAYMAPEQALGSVSRASDLYALGVMAYELVTGARPFAGPDFLEQKLQQRFEPPSRRGPGLPSTLDAFFARALAADPTKRFSSASELRAAFEAAFAPAAEKA